MGTLFMLVSIPFLPSGICIIRGVLFEIKEFLFPDVPDSTFEHALRASKEYHNARAYRKDLYMEKLVSFWSLQHFVLIKYIHLKKNNNANSEDDKLIL